MFIYMEHGTAEYSSDIIRRLRSMAKTAASYFHGIEIEEFYHIAWVAFHESKLQHKSNPLSFARAEFAIKDAMRDWIAHEPGHVIEDGVLGNLHLERTPDPLSTGPRKTRTKLPRVVKRALQQLTPRERRAIYLGYMWNRTHEEIALALGIPVSTAGTTRFRALKKLRTLLQVNME